MMGLKTKTKKKESNKTGCNTAAAGDLQEAAEALGQC